jgi:hypothetical protein
MKKEFLKIAGVKTEQEFYDRYPSEEDFFKAHPNALKQLAGGGEAYPQTATMDNFFSYGVPVPPTYYRHGGAFPMAQSEDQFFSPFYGNVPNPYNKAMGGSSEPYRQAMSFPYGNTGRSTHFMMQDGGYSDDEQTLPKMGVNGKLLEFVGTLKNTAANKLNSNLRMYGKVKNPEQYEFEQARYGGNLKGYQSKNTPGGINDISLNGKTGPLFDPLNLPQIDTNSDKGTVNNYYYGPGQQGPQNSNQQIPAEYQNDIDYLYGRRRPRSDFDIKGKGMFGNYSSTGWLKDEYGMDRLRQMGLSRMDESNPRWWQLLKRPTKTYYFGQQGQGPMGYVPGQVDQQGMPLNQNNSSFMPDDQNNDGVPDGAPQSADYLNQKRKQKGDGFFNRLFNRDGNISPQPGNITPQPGTITNVVPDQQVKGDDMISQRSKQMWNPEFTDRRNQRVQNRVGRIDQKLDKLDVFKNWQQKQLGNENIGLSGKRGRQEKRLLGRRGRLEDKMTGYEGFVDPNMPPQKYGGQQLYQAKDTPGTVKTPGGKEVPLNEHKRGEKTTFKPSMTVEEYLRSKEMSEGLKQQIKDSNNPDTPMAPMQGVTDRQQIGNQPTGHTTIILNESKGKSSAPYSYSPAFDEQLAKDIISSNEQNFFRTKSIDEPFDPSKHSEDWRTYALDNTPGEAYKNNPALMNAYWNKMFSKNGKKEKTWNQFNDMPAPLRTVAADIMYNQKTDPREILLAAAGVPQMGAFSKYAGDYSMTGDAGRSNRRAIKDDVDKLWKDNKDMILQQYNDDPRAFTDAFSDYRDVYMQNTRTSDLTSDDPRNADKYLLYGDDRFIETDTSSKSGYPGTQYNAWHGRTDNTRNMVDDKYFGPNSGYVAPQFAGGGSYNAGDVVDMTPEELQRFIAMGGQVEFLD